MDARIVVIDDEPLIRVSIADALSNLGCRVLTAEDGPKGIELIKRESPQVVITDLRLPGQDGFQVLKAAKELPYETGVILITAYGDVKSAVEAMKKGALDYLTKPFQMEELILMVERFLRYQQMEEENIRLREEVAEKRAFYNIIGRGPAMERVFDLISTVAPRDSSVLIQGETGVGKELVAHAIHNLSPRNGGPFIKINCAAIPENLLESELFGHEKGAFTGAIQRRKGKIEIAHKGTIFFDEIGDMALPLQAKLLRVLESMEFERIGGNETIKVDVRSIFATQKDLKEMVEKGGFREDLYYRVNVVPITIPPLRERREDIPLLIEHFLNYYCQKMGRPPLGLSPEANSRFLTYEYPGNVRELQHAIEMAVALCKGEGIELKHLPLEIQGRVVSSSPQSFPDDTSLAKCVKGFERQRIIKVLQDVGGKKGEAAKRLGITRKSLWQKIKELNIPA